MNREDIKNIFKKEHPDAVKIIVHKPSLIFKCSNCRNKLIFVDLYYRNSGIILPFSKGIHKGARHAICPSCKSKYVGQCW